MQHKHRALAEDIAQEALNISDLDRIDDYISDSLQGSEYTFKPIKAWEVIAGCDGAKIRRAMLDCGDDRPEAMAFNLLYSVAMAYANENIEA